MIKDGMDAAGDRYGIAATVEELLRQRLPRRQAALAMPRRATTTRDGALRSAFVGRGMEFAESRAYQAGDDVRAIDWRVTARTGRTHTKLFHEERERPVLLLVDLRASMRFGTRDATKAVLAARAAAAIAWAARDAGDRFGALLLTDAGIVEVEPQRSRARLLSLLRRLADATRADLGEAAAPAPSMLADALARLAHVSRPGTLVCLLSDFADLDERGERELTRLGHSASVACVLVHDALEMALPVDLDLRVADARGEHVSVLPSDDPAWRAHWTERFAIRRGRLEHACRKYRMAFLTLRTGDDARDLLRADQLGRAFAGGHNGSGGAA